MSPIGSDMPEPIYNMDDVLAHVGPFVVGEISAPEFVDYDGDTEQLLRHAGEALAGVEKILAGED